jgi:hypothetical protein
MKKILLLAFISVTVIGYGQSYSDKWSHIASAKTFKIENQLNHDLNIRFEIRGCSMGFSTSIPANQHRIFGIRGDSYFSVRISYTVPNSNYPKVLLRESSIPHQFIDENLTIIVNHPQMLPTQNFRTGTSYSVDPERLILVPCF